MLENSLFKDEKSRRCEANKKISYKQLSPIKTSKALNASTLASGNIYIDIHEGDVIETALFKRVVRDCKGNSILETDLLRLRTVGSNDWISFEKNQGENILASIFAPSTDLEAIEFVKREIESGDLKGVESKIQSIDKKGNKKAILIGLALLSVSLLVTNKLLK